MKTTVFFVILVLISTVSTARQAWLSTPESIDQFRQQVESMKPDSSQFDVEVSDLDIQLSGRKVAIRIYRPGAERIRENFARQAAFSICFLN